MRAMIARGIVPSAIAGRIRCRKASIDTSNWPLMMPAGMYRPEMKSRIAARRALELGQAPDLDERRHLDPGAEPGGRGQGERRALQQQPEDEREDEAQDEDRDGHAEVGDGHRADVGLRVPAVSGDEAKGDADGRPRRSSP